jgi:hypothetical protein
MKITSSLNTSLIAKVRERKLAKEGYDTKSVNWEHYAKVLEAKKEKILASH